MKISRVILRHIRMPLQVPFETSFGKIHTRDCILVEVIGEGTNGIGECVADRDPGYSYETIQTAWHILKDYLAPVVLNNRISEPCDIHHLTGFIRGHPMAKAGLEMALWDLEGKITGQPLHQLLGGIRSIVAVGVSIGIQESPQVLLRVVEEFLTQGYQRIKIKIKPGRDVTDTEIIRKAFPDILLQVDANSAFTLDHAKTLLHLDELHLLLIEQPLAEDDLWEHSQLQRMLKTPICLDESILTPRHACNALDMGACRIINIKAGRVGGLSQALAIHKLCLSRNIPVWCGGMLETGVGRSANLALASLPGFLLPGDISATDRYYAEDITEQRYFLNPDSTINVPNGPGLGIDINRNILDKFTLSSMTLP